MATFSSVSSQEATAPGEYGENYDADPALLIKALGTTEGVPDIALAAFSRAGLPVGRRHARQSAGMLAATAATPAAAATLTLAIADGFGENVWREITHMEVILQALDLP